MFFNFLRILLSSSGSYFSCSLLLTTEDNSRVILCAFLLNPE